MSSWSRHLLTPVVLPHVITLGICALIATVATLCVVWPVTIFFFVVTAVAVWFYFMVYVLVRVARM